MEKTVYVPDSRQKTIEKTSLIGIAGNVMLSAFKAVIGLVTGSIAIILDAVNNLSDALSSLITVIGIRLAVKAPDKDHPFGHGRTEYISSLSIAGIVIFAGASSLVESVKAILHPSSPDYNAISLIIVGAAIFTKIFLGLYFRKVGDKVDSDSLKNSGTDALMDAVISTMTLIAAFIFIIFHIAVEPYLAAIISIVILKSGIDMVRETLSKILGEGTEAEEAALIKKDIKACDERIIGAYDLVLHDYGPGNKIGSVHIEIPDTMTVNEMDALSRKITEEIALKHKIVLAAVGVYSYNTKNPQAVEVRTDIKKKAAEYSEVMELHGFYLNEETREIRFDLVMRFDKDDSKTMEQFEEVEKYVKDTYPGYNVYIGLDRNFSGK